MQNIGTRSWSSRPPDGHGVNLVLRFYETVSTFDLPSAAIAPGEVVTVPIEFDVPRNLAGQAFLTVDLVRQNVAFFSDCGSEPLILELAGMDERPNAASFGQARNVGRYGVEFGDFSLPPSVIPHSRFGVCVCVRNRGGMTWDPTNARSQRVSAVVFLNGQAIASAPLPHQVVPLQNVYVHFVVPAPKKPGRYRLHVNMVHEGVAFFHDHGVASLEIPLQVDNAPAPAGADLYDVALRSNSSFYQPSGGVSHFSDGKSFPLLLRQAQGCHVWDSEGRKYIDYTMGWGCALLGHGERNVEQAVRQSMGCGPTLPMAHMLELQLTADLCDEAEIPCAESVVFGKNGSDVCTLAIRLARVVTGRKKILFCGYHGWQDWYAEPLGFAETGVPERDPLLVMRFPFNQVDAARTAIAANRTELAAVILEPSGPSLGAQGLGEDVKNEFLRALAAETRAAGALLIFDEIITGFRYPRGSVQKFTGVVPDLACFGKALGNGFPISALLGRRHIIGQLARAFYGPTFKGELYSLAAARAAVSIYRSQPVAEHVWSFGQRLQQSLRQISDDLKLRARIVGPPFRTALVFDEPNRERLTLIRTLYIQELLREGLITYNGIMLPSYAHDEDALQQTIMALDAALQRVKRACDLGDDMLQRQIEIPLITVGP